MKIMQNKYRVNYKKKLKYKCKIIAKFHQKRYLFFKYTAIGAEHNTVL